MSLRIIDHAGSQPKRCRRELIRTSEVPGLTPLGIGLVVMIRAHYRPGEPFVVGDPAFRKRIGCPDLKTAEIARAAEEMLQLGIITRVLGNGRLQVYCLADPAMVDLDDCEGASRAAPRPRPLTPKIARRDIAAAVTATAARAPTAEAVLAAVSSGRINDHQRDGLTPRELQAAARRQREAELLAEIVAIEAQGRGRDAIAIIARRHVLDPSDPVEIASFERRLRRLRERERSRALRRKIRTRVRSAGSLAM